MLDTPFGFIKSSNILKTIKKPLKALAPLIPGGHPGAQFALSFLVPGSNSREKSHLPPSVMVPPPKRHSCSGHVLPGYPEPNPRRCQNEPSPPQHHPHILPFQNDPNGLRPASNGRQTGGLQTAMHDILGNPALSVEEKVVLLAGLMADALDKQAEKLLSSWGEQLRRGAHQGNYKNPNGRGETGENDSNFSQYMQVQIQRILQKKNQLISTASNLSKSEHETKKGVINNLRV